MELPCTVFQPKVKNLRVTRARLGGVPLALSDGFVQCFEKACDFRVAALMTRRYSLIRRLNLPLGL